MALDDIVECAAELPPEHAEVLEAVLALPERYRDAVYLHYYEGYSAADTARLLRAQRKYRVYAAEPCAAAAQGKARG